MMDCRFCNKKLKDPFLSLGSSPLSNFYVSEEKLHEKEPSYPLEVYVCDGCFLVQLPQFEISEKIFSEDYPYFSSFSESWLLHCRDYAAMAADHFRLHKDSLIVEIGSNDGYLLQYFKERNIPVLGIEPARNAAMEAIGKGISTEIAFFNSAYANRMVESGKKADLIVGNNVLAHNPDLHDFVAGLKTALKSSGVITMEFPHILNLLKYNQFDTIYHEHFSYFSFNTVCRLFEYHKLPVFDVDEVPTHGGSLRIYAKHKEDKTKLVTPKVRRLLEKEESFGILMLSTYYKFGEKVELVKKNLLRFLMELKRDKKSIVGYGAPAKGNTLLNYCGIKADLIDYTVDRNPHKQNRYLPGSRIPIRHPDRIKENRPDYILILPWNLKEEIIQQLSFVRQWGAKFIIPIPMVEVI